MKDYSPAIQIELHRAEVIVSTYRTRLGQLQVGGAFLILASLGSLYLSFNHPWNEDTIYRVMFWISIPIFYLLNFKQLKRQRNISATILELAKD
jgi:hypothetical protein